MKTLVEANLAYKCFKVVTTLLTATNKNMSVIGLLLTCVAVEVCKVSKTGAGACIHVGRGSKDVTTQVTEEVIFLVMELLLLGLSTAHYRRLVTTRDAFEKKFNK